MGFWSPRAVSDSEMFASILIFVSVLAVFVGLIQANEDADKLILEKPIGMGVIERCVKPGMVALTFDDGVSYLSTNYTFNNR